MNPSNSTYYLNDNSISKYLLIPFSVLSTGHSTVVPGEEDSK